MEYVIYTFESSNMAYLALNLMEENSIRARLIPLLPEIDAGCGLCLRFEEKYKENVEILIKNSLVSYKERYKLIYTDKKRKPEVLTYDLS